MWPRDLLLQFFRSRHTSGQMLGWDLAPMTFGLFEKIVLAFAAQIFFDIFGETATAIDAALALGFSLPQNFNAPYAAVGFSNFWWR